MKIRCPNNILSRHYHLTGGSHSPITVLRAVISNVYLYNISVTWGTDNANFEKLYSFNP